MASDLFSGLCVGFGYRPETVLSVRVTAHKVVVVHVDDSGEIRQALHRLPPGLESEAVDTATVLEAAR